MDVRQPVTPDLAVKESFDEEVARLKRSEITALVRVVSAQGEVADRGTWIRTRVKAEIVRLITGPSDRQLGESIEFSFSAGTAQIGNVV
jgi:hypothetical protein